MKSTRILVKILTYQRNLKKVTNQFWTLINEYYIRVRAFIFSSRKNLNSNQRVKIFSIFQKKCLKECITFH